MKTAEWQQQRRAGDFIVKLKKTPFLLFYFWTSKYRMGGYFFKTYLLNI